MSMFPFLCSSKRSQISLNMFQKRVFDCCRTCKVQYTDLEPLSSKPSEVLSSLWSSSDDERKKKYSTSHSKAPQKMIKISATCEKVSIFREKWRLAITFCLIFQFVFKLICPPNVMFDVFACYFPKKKRQTAAADCWRSPGICWWLNWSSCLCCRSWCMRGVWNSHEKCQKHKHNINIAWKRAALGTNFTKMSGNWEFSSFSRLTLLLYCWFYANNCS